MAQQTAVVKADRRPERFLPLHRPDQNSFVFEAGQFRLDEMTRVLSIRDRDIVLQPKVFDLLVYLARHRSRVVSKDELLDEVWPDVTVTDNSVQRAVSMLRSLLREEGLENAVRTFPRSGYRFCLDIEKGQDREPAETRRSADDGMAACEAIAQQQWHEAAQIFERMDSDHRLNGNAFDQWALAQHCLGQPSKAIVPMTRAIGAHVEAQQSAKAAAAAALLSIIYLERGATSVAQGWLAFAKDLAAAHTHEPGAGYVLLAASRMAACACNFDYARCSCD